MTTSLSDFHEAIRVIVRDTHPDVQKYPANTLDSYTRTAIRMNKLPGHTLTPDLSSITPGIADPNKYALLVYHVVKMMADPEAASSSYRTRALSESFGPKNWFVNELSMRIHELENGELFASWTSLWSWVAGTSGVPIVAALSEIKTRPPFRTVTLNLDGASIN